MVRLHPYEYTYFKAVEGGIHGAHGDYAMDYWGLAFKQAGNRASKRRAAKAEHPPAGQMAHRGLRAAASGEAELGPEFVTTWDPKGADFVLKLGEFYCAAMLERPA